MDIKSPVAEARNEYTYSASGAKLKAVQKWNPNYSTSPVIGSTVNTAALTMSSTTDYAGNIIYENGKLKRILVDGGYYDSGNYYFYITDHLGNNRIVANAAASVVQSTQYYPFGIPFADATGTSAQPYKYNGKELDSRNGLNMSDYSARWKYDWNFPTVDPLAEKYYSWSPYAYVKNNPLKYIDPTGMYSTAEWMKDNGISSSDMTNIYTASTENTNPDPPTDIYTYIGGDMQSKNSYIHRENVNDGKNGIEVLMPDYVVEAKAPSRPSLGTVAIAWDYVSFDVQGGIAVATSKSVIRILVGDYAGEEFVTKNTTIAGGSLGASATTGITLYSYYGDIKDITPYLFAGKSDVVNTSYDLGASFGFGQTIAKTVNGTLHGRVLSIGYGIGPPISIYSGTTTTEIY